MVSSFPHALDLLAVCAVLCQAAPRPLPSPLGPPTLGSMLPPPAPTHASPRLPRPVSGAFPQGAVQPGSSTLAAQLSRMDPSLLALPGAKRGCARLLSGMGLPGGTIQPA